jgi:DNA-binding MarR family transcriptional regulator
MPADALPAKPDSAEEDFGLLLARAYTVWVHQLHTALAEAGFEDLGRWHGYVFRALDRGTLNLRDLAQRLGMTSPGAIKIVDEMAGQGYVERFRDEHDGRVRLLRLADRGHRALAEARAFHQRFEASLASTTGGGDTAVVRRVLHHIITTQEGAGDLPLGPV